jgi:hypothetical protein
MKKFVAFSMGALMALGFSACSDDDIAGTTSVDDTALAYINVNIVAQDDASTRAAASDDVLKLGEDSEHSVGEVEFYFFDANKKFISLSELSTSFKNVSDDKNVESTSGNIVIVPEYDVTNPPRYVITVLNATEQIAMKKGDDISIFYALADGAFKTTATKNEDSGKYMIGVSNNNSFVMSTSTYKHEDTSELSYATDLKDANFYDTKKEAEEAPTSEYTTIYVERLAAKVLVSFDKGNVTSKWTTDADKGIFNLGYFDLNNTGAKNTHLYAKFIGWGLDGTAKKTYYSKHIDTTWGDNLLGNNDWNDVKRYRSYWAQSYYYTSTNTTSEIFPKEYYQDEKVLEGANANASSFWQGANGVEYYKGFSLNFINQKEMEQYKIGEDPLYCGENTNSGTYLTSAPNIAGAATCVLMLAQLQVLEDGVYKSPGDIVKFQGNYYNATKLSEKFLSAINAKGYKYTTEEGQAVEDALELDAEKLSYVKDDDLLNGRVQIQINDEITKNAKKWFDADNNELTDVTAETLNTKLSKTQGANPMVKFTNGYMYYYTPIYHLTTNAITDAGGVPEGYYGVVRNHWYEVNITGFRKKSTDSPYNPENPKDESDKGYGPDGPDDKDDPIDPGHGIDDPYEPIVPTTEEDVKYYLGTNINILSWRVVEQNVKL